MSLNSLAQALRRLRVIAYADPPHYAHDPRYTLEKGLTGAKRWHLLHPEVEHPDPKPLPTANLSLEDIMARPVSVLSLKRVPVLTQSHGGQEVLIKPVEDPAYAQAAEETAQALHLLGAPHLGYEVLKPSDDQLHPLEKWYHKEVYPRAGVWKPKNLDEQMGNNTNLLKSWRLIERNGLSVVPFIAVPDGPLLDGDEWAQRMEGRLYGAETVWNAPDRHEYNYVDIPVRTPGGIAATKVGIDYEWIYYGGGPLRHWSFTPGRFSYDVLTLMGYEMPDERPTDPHRFSQRARGVLDVLDNVPRLVGAFGREIDNRALDFEYWLNKSPQSDSSERIQALRQIYQDWVYAGKP